jgi:hypothetical protein
MVIRGQIHNGAPISLYPAINAASLSLSPRRQLAFEPGTTNNASFSECKDQRYWTNRLALARLGFVLYDLDFVVHDYRTLWRDIASGCRGLDTRWQDNASVSKPIDEFFNDRFQRPSWTKCWQQSRQVHRTFLSTKRRVKASLSACAACSAVAALSREISSRRIAMLSSRIDRADARAGKKNELDTVPQMATTASLVNAPTMRVKTPATTKIAEKP